MSKDVAADRLDKVASGREPYSHVLDYAVGIVPSASALDELERVQSKFEPAAMIKVPRESLRLTLVTLASDLDRDAKKMARVREAINRAAREAKPIDITIGGIGCWPKWNKVREIWVGVTDGKEKLADLSRRIQAYIETTQSEARPIRSPHRAKIRIGIWKDIYVSSMQGELAKEISESINSFPIAHFITNELSLFATRPDETSVSIHSTSLGK
ncbi:uncharacterized protein LOC126326528 [Schistocerca gregaria]|uniref:uncharacterized protein LOC126326528 n=1 Tax=Schistocerca gregaria TaxID=7010 RepID=UPI00211DFC1D|nr:uncharacterized protein LOC126326528 [Schistocerca gregaria]